MTQIVMDLFRMTVIKYPLTFKEHHNASYKGRDASIGDLIKNAFNAQNNKKSDNVRWLIGNLLSDGEYMCFQFGKTSTTKTSEYDNEAHKFLDKENPDARYTNVYIDQKYEMVGIVQNSKLPQTEILANRIANIILRNCDNNSVLNITINPIFDSTGLVKIVDSAYAVTNVVFETTPPNPWDADDFSKHMQGYVAESNGEKGKVSVSGPDLNKETVKSTIRSTNSLGQGRKVQVRIRENANDRPIMKKYENIIKIIIDKKDDFLSVVKKIRQKYPEIKQGNTDDES